MGNGSPQDRRKSDNNQPAKKGNKLVIAIWVAVLFAAVLFFTVR